MPSQNFNIQLHTFTCFRTFCVAILYVDWTCKIKYQNDNIYTYRYKQYLFISRYLVMDADINTIKNIKPYWYMYSSTTINL